MENDQLNPAAAPAAPAAAPRRLPVWVVLISFLVLAGFMWLIGWGLSRAMRGAIVVGDPVPSFTMTSFDGQVFETGDYAGKVIVINFWASWCKPCEAEARELEEAYRHFEPGGEVVFLGLAYADTEPKSLDYLRKFGITYPNGPDLATRVSQMFRIGGVPETFIIDKQGRLAYFKKGPFSSTDEIIAAVERVLR
jgi:cytochrome c biogenesis protein CcmG, thiol:disulfide interchange protein DsbE